MGERPPMTADPNPHRPPQQSEAVSTSGGSESGFVCPVCQTDRSFIWFWVLQPVGHCGNCHTRLVVRRPGLHKLWTPLLFFGLFCGGSALSLYLFGPRAVIAVPLLLAATILIDGLIACRTGYLARPRGIL